jgi:hypothetical protein
MQLSPRCPEVSEGSTSGSAEGTPYRFLTAVPTAGAPGGRGTVRRGPHSSPQRGSRTCGPVSQYGCPRGDPKRVSPIWGPPEFFRGFGQRGAPRRVIRGHPEGLPLGCPPEGVHKRGSTTGCSREGANKWSPRGGPAEGIPLKGPHMVSNRGPPVGFTQKCSLKGVPREGPSDGFPQRGSPRGATGVSPGGDLQMGSDSGVPAWGSIRGNPPEVVSQSLPPDGAPCVGWFERFSWWVPLMGSQRVPPI